MPNPLAPDAFNATIDQAIREAGMNVNQEKLSTFKDLYQEHYNAWEQQTDERAKDKLSSFKRLLQYIANIKSTQDNYPAYQLSFTADARINAYLDGCTNKYPDLDDQKIQAGEDTLQEEILQAKGKQQQQEAKLAQAKHDAEQAAKQQAERENAQHQAQAQLAKTRYKAAIEDQKKCNNLMARIRSEFVQEGLLNSEDVASLETHSSGPFKNLEAKLKITLVQKIEEKSKQFINDNQAKQKGLTVRGEHNRAIAARKATPPLETFKNALEEMTFELNQLATQSDRRHLELEEEFRTQMEAEIRKIRNLKPTERISTQDQAWIAKQNTPAQRENAKAFVAKLAVHVKPFHKITNRLDKQNKMFGGKDPSAETKSREIKSCFQAVPLSDLGHIGDQEHAKEKVELKNLHHSMAKHRGSSKFKASEDGVIDKKTAANSFRLLMAHTKDGSESVTLNTDTSPAPRK